MIPRTFTFTFIFIRRNIEQVSVFLSGPKYNPRHKNGIKIRKAVAKMAFPEKQKILTLKGTAIELRTGVLDRASGKSRVELSNVDCHQ